MMVELRSTRPNTHHLCPRRGCRNEVDNRLFCCSGDWWGLSVAARANVVRTRTLPEIAPERRRAIEQARSEWDLLDKAEEANDGKE